MTPTADVVLPCLDEAGALPWVLARIPPGWRAVVVDNGSSDGSARIAAELGATVVHERRRGFGAACHAGLLAAEAEFVCFCDCDASLDPGLLPGFVDRIATGDADLVLGRRRPTARGAFPPHARAGNAALVRMLRRRTGLRLRDLGPLRAAHRESLLDLGMRDRRSGYPLETVVLAADAGWRIAEQDVPYHPRTGRSKVTGTWRGTWHAVHDMRAVLHTAAVPPAPSVRNARTPLHSSAHPSPRDVLPAPEVHDERDGSPAPAAPARELTPDTTGPGYGQASLPAPALPATRPATDPLAVRDARTPLHSSAQPNPRDVRDAPEVHDERGGAR